MNDTTTDELKASYDAIWNELQSLTFDNSIEPVSLGLDLTLNGEVYLHSSSHEAFDEDEEWVIDYTHRLPLMDLSWDIYAEDIFYGRMEFSGRTNRYEADTTSSEFFFSDTFNTNLVFNKGFENTDASFPWRAFLSAGGNNWNLQFGRDRLDWGHGITGNLLVSDHMDFHEFIRLSLFSDKVKYSFTTMGFSPEDWTNYQDPLPYLKCLIAHSLEYAPTDKLLLGVTESIMFEGEVFDFRFLNPMMFYHNCYMPGNANTMVTFEANYTPIPGITLYGQTAIDEISAPGEATDIDGANPEAIGYITGARYVTVDEDRTFYTNLEFAYTDPFLYLRNYDDSPINFIVGNRQFTRGSSGIVYDLDFLGYPYGCDAIVIDLNTGLLFLDGLAIRGDIFYMAHGEHDEETENEATAEACAEETPTGTVEHTLILTGSADIPISEMLSAGVSCSGITIWNHDNLASDHPVFDLQLTAGVTCCL